MLGNLKRTAYGFSILFLLIAVLFAFLGMHVIRDAYTNEIHTVQNLAGRVLSVYPEAETAFAQALRDMDREDAAAGAEFLARYGYDEREKIGENESYRYVVKRLFVISALLCIVCIVCVCSCLCTVAKRGREQEERILAVLEKYLSDDFRFVEEEAFPQMFANPLFADILSKLGRKLKVKTEWLKEERDHTKELVTDISHQLKTPISALKVCFPLYSEAEDASEREEFRIRCMTQMDKLELLASSLVEISHLETQIIRLQPEDVLLDEILTESVNAVYHKAAKKRISIEMIEIAEAGEGISPQETEAQRGEAGAECDVEKVRQEGGLMLYLDKKWSVEAVANVLDNAVKYSPSGSCILIRIQKLYSFLRLEIEDSGIGVPREEYNRIFRRFYRGSSETVKKEEGVGVGLYLSRKILEDEGGTICVRPAKGQGSIFVIQLPYTRAGSIH